ncbi:MAG: hypothetical protein JNL51_03600 [Chitinophagaceae bacterium]|nr:hypothetical protein [Chitinophagaceae bacterium]
MKQISAMLMSILVLSGCIKVNIGDDTGGGLPGGSDPNETKILTGTIDQSVALRKGTYTLKGYVYVNNGAILTIEKGSIIKSDITEKGALIVERGSKLIAEGTPAEPIVFTSGKAPGERAAGDWGGIILLGKAPTNRPTSPAPIIEGGVNRPFGGTDPADNSGILKYVRIEFSGIAAEPNSEINGLTCGGVGTGTILEYIQVSYGADDAYEFFGGTVNAKNLVAYATYDDDYDFDFGYSGKIQFAVSLRDKPADTDQANGIECDNDGTGTTATPFTRPQLSNLTLIGPYDTTGSSANHGFSNRWRRSTRFALNNSILLGHRMAGFSMESGNTVRDYYTNGESQFKNNVIAVYTKPFNVDSSGARAITSYPANPLSPTDRAAMISEAIGLVRTKAEAEGNTVFNSRDEVLLTDPFNFPAPDFRPKAGSPAASGASFTGLDNFFTPTTYRGAFGSTNWTEGWASFTPKTNVY